MKQQRTTQLHVTPGSKINRRRFFCVQLLTDGIKPLLNALMAVVVLGSLNALVARAEAAATSDTVRDFYLEQIAQPVIAARCLACHVTGGVAPNSGAALVFTRNNDDANLAAIINYLDDTGDAGGTLLGKTRGVSHGGGVVFNADSAPYRALSQLVDLLLSPGDADTDQFPDVVNNNDTGNDAAPSYYVAEVDPVITRHCTVCHGPGLAAAEAGARLVLGGTAAARQSALDGYATELGDSGDWLLAKTLGDAEHGGGQVLADGSEDFLTLARYLISIGVISGDSDESIAKSFWDNTSLEDRRVTLRRAAVLMAGEVPDEAALARASASEAGLYHELIALMTGDGFKQFIMTGANDRLLVSGLLSGIDFSFEIAPRYPAAAELFAEFPDRVPEEHDGYREKPFMTRGEADFATRWGLVRAPLELIVHVVMQDLPYQEILTAPYTMVNKFTEVAYRTDELNFPAPFTDEQGFWDRSIANEFAPGRDRGQVPNDDDHYYDWQTQTFRRHGEFIARPHAGILSMPAWLARYPSTDTNRNRARARWTYYHFLGIDIEQSAPRSTDPDALADTDNPTLKNPACTVCHQRLDQVAGAYQLYGDAGTFKDQYGGMDSLSEYYKFPERFGGQASATPYRHGDTWYRDMRPPGFEAQRPSRSADSLQWLGRTIAEDPRFARATVQFWWPAVFGAETLSAPTDSNHPDYEASLNAFSEQDALINELAERFAKSGYQLKTLLANMMMSRWYRTDSVDSAPTPKRGVELATVGRGRLLTPEELDRKNRAVFGRSWGERVDGKAHHIVDSTYLTSPHTHESVNTLYGGIDGASMLQRNRDMTPLMSNVAKRMALEMACQVVLEEFEKPAAERRVFSHVEKTTIPGVVTDASWMLEGKVASVNADWRDHQRTTAITHPGGRLELRLADATPNSYDRIDADASSNADLILKSVTIYENGLMKRRIRGVDVLDMRGFSADTYTDNQGRQHWRGDVRVDVPGFWLHEQSWLSFTVDLPAGDYTLEWSLATSLHRNALSDGILARVLAVAIDRPNESEGSQQLKNQIAALLLRATNTPASGEQVNGMLQMISDYAAEQRQQGSWAFDQDNHCDTWGMGWRHLTPEEWHRRQSDPSGMLRGWTLAVEAILSSYQYLHD